MFNWTLTGSIKLCFPNSLETESLSFIFYFKFVYVRNHIFTYSLSVVICKIVIYYSRYKHTSFCWQKPFKSLRWFKSKINLASSLVCHCWVKGDNCSVCISVLILMVQHHLQVCPTCSPWATPNLWIAMNLAQTFVVGMLLCQKIGHC